jgi:hypothetical protein
VDLERSKPIEGWGTAFLNGMGLAAFLAAVVLVTSYVH